MSKPPPVDRRHVLKVLGIASVPLVLGETAALAGFHPAVPRQEGETEWSPRALSREQVRLVAEIAERIVPQTETSGAKAAFVHQYIDWRHGEASQERQAELLAALERVDTRARELSDAPFAELTDERRDLVLASLFEQSETSADRAAVERLKDLTVAGYYRSEAGMLEEMDYDGNKFLTRFDGCTHEEHLRWSPPEDSAERPLARELKAQLLPLQLERVGDETDADVGEEVAADVGGDAVDGDGEDA